MKFLYEYQDKSNKRHSGSLNAATRAAAYAALKAQGIKPIRCEEAPGLFNLVFGKGKRWLAIAVLALVCVGLATAVLMFRRETVALNAPLESCVRRQLIGDTALIEKGIRTGWSDVFDLEGDRFLASFAIPGVAPAIRTTTEEHLKTALDKDCPLPDATTSLEARQVLAVVSGMKAEIRSLLASGWTLREVGVSLVERQDEEIAYYERAKTEIEMAAKSGIPPEALERLLDQRNASLRKLGIRLVSMPEQGLK